jgi:radical SAM/Cys-rich protein
MLNPDSEQDRIRSARDFPSFEDSLKRHGAWPLRRPRVRTVQVNVGKLCNQACHHCHVEAGPKRTEIMTAETAARLLDLLLEAPEVETVDFTGGAPELNPSFRSLVEGGRRAGKRVLVRCNLTVLFEPGQEDTPEFFRRHGVHLVCSLPCYTADNVDRQRGRGVFDRSIEALQVLNGLGYGDEELPLDLVYNPLGAFLPPSQSELEAKYRDELQRLFGIRFRRLLTLANFPVKRFADMLARSGETERYLDLLLSHFNPATIDGLMCRDMVSVAWDGALHDCDFHQMEEIPLLRDGKPQSLWTIDAFANLHGAAIAAATHCYGCTAGAGSSCGGSLA